MMKRLCQFLLPKSQQIQLRLGILDPMIQLKGRYHEDTFAALVLAFLLEEDVQLIQYIIAGYDVNVRQIVVVGLAVLSCQVSQVVLRERCPVRPGHQAQVFGSMVLLEELLQ